MHAKTKLAINELYIRFIGKAPMLVHVGVPLMNSIKLKIKYFNSVKSEIIQNLWKSLKLVKIKFLRKY